MDIGDNKKIMARNIKTFMERKGVTNKQLCSDLEFKYTTFMDWLNGNTYPRIGKVEAMANYFGCEKSDLIEDKTTMENNPQALAELHFEMVSDEDLVEMFPDFKRLDARKRKIIKDLARDLAESGA